MKGRVKMLNTSGNPSSAYEAACEAGRRLKKKWWARKEMLNSREAASAAGISVSTLNRRVNKRRVLALTLEGSRERRFPSWQFDFRFSATCQDIISTLTHFEPWGIYLFFTQPEPLLGACPPLSVLRKGKERKVFEVAKILNDDWDIVPSQPYIPSE